MQKQAGAHNPPGSPRVCVRCAGLPRSGLSQGARTGPHTPTHLPRRAGEGLAARPLCPIHATPHSCFSSVAWASVVSSAGASSLAGVSSSVEVWASSALGSDSATAFSASATFFASSA